MSLLSFAIASMIIILIPGTGVVYTVSTGLTRGRRSSLFAAIGCTAGIVPHLILSIALSSLLMRMSQQAFTVLKLLGALYLIYLGAGMILSRENLRFDREGTEEKASAVARRGVLINLLNPKLTLFFFSFLPQYASGSGRDYVSTVSLMGFAFMLMTLIVFILYGALAGTMRRAVEKSPARIRLVSQLSGIVFLAFAVNLAVSSI